MSDAFTAAHYTAEPIEDDDGALLAFRITRTAEPIEDDRHPAGPIGSWVVEIPTTEVADLLAEVVGLLGYYGERPPRPNSKRTAQILHLVPAGAKPRPALQPPR